MIQKYRITAFLFLIYVTGSALIVYNGRPVMKLKNQVASATATNQISPLAFVNQEIEAGVEIEDEQEEESPAVQPAQPSRIQQPTKTTQIQTTQTQPSQANTSGALSFSMEDVGSHNTRSNCWSAINGSVYDLTSFVERHPGGASRIVALCGTDGSSAFNRQHGGSTRAQSMLVLLKIGFLSS